MLVLLVSYKFLIVDTCTAVPPAYYAHLAAFRARYYIEGDNSDGASVGRGSGGSAAQNQVLPDVHEFVKDVMFFC